MCKFVPRSHKKAIRCLLVFVSFCLWPGIKCIAADTHYVSLSGTNNSPYLNWADAATQIQWAVDASTAGDTVLVSNGTYYLTNQINIAVAITTTSVNGRNVTIVDGNYPGYTNRCFYLTNATLDGFTVRNGHDTNDLAGGIYAVTGAKIQNCRIISNNAFRVSKDGGKGVYLNASTISNCDVVGNFNGGIGAYVGASVLNCVVASNVVAPTNGAPSSREAHGGGIAAYDVGTIINACTVYGNSNNTAGYGNCFGGGVLLGFGASLRNSLVYNNNAKLGGGVSQYSSSCTVKNCTIVSNYATSAAGGIYLSCPNLKTAYVENVICYFNISGSGSNLATYSTGTFYIVNSCIAPTNDFPTNGIAGYYYANNIQSNPQFVDKDTGNWRLKVNSPCINSGTNEAWMTGAFDLDGHLRIHYGTVDMGAYETIYNGTVYRIP